MSIWYCKKKPDELVVTVASYRRGNFPTRFKKKERETILYELGRIQILL
jgi:hypothetical protein